MLPVQQNVQFPQREINLTQSDESSLQKQAVPVMQISNVQEQPSTSKKPRLSASSLGAELKSIGKQRQREILTLLLMIMLEQEEFVYFEDQIVGMGHFRPNERFNHLELISAVYRAQAALFSMKTHIVELIALKKEREKIQVQAKEEVKRSQTKIKVQHEGISFAMASFCRKGTEYCQLLFEISSEDKKQPSAKRKISNRRGYAPCKKEKAEKSLKISKDLYDEKCKKRNLTDCQIMNYIRVYLYEKKFITQINKIFSALSVSEIQEIVRLTELENVSNSEKPPVQPFEQVFPQSATQPSSSSSSIDADSSISPSILSQQQADVQQQGEFKILRKPVYEDFWRSLKTRLSKRDYLEKFYQFVYTNWNSEYENEKTLKQELLKAKKNKNYQERYKLLLQKCFQKKLKANAIKLIYYIIKTREYQLELEKLSGDDLNEKTSQRNQAIARVNKVAEDDYRRNYLKHQKSDDNPSSGIEKLITEIDKRCSNISRDFRQYETYVNTNISNNLEYINNILKLLKDQKNVTASIVKLLIYNTQSLRELLKNESNPQPRSRLGKRPYVSSQGRDQPSQKKSLIGDTRQAEGISPSQSSLELPNLISRESLFLMRQQVLPRSLANTFNEKQSATFNSKDVAVDDNMINQIFWKKCETEIDIEQFYSCFLDFIQNNVDQNVPEKRSTLSLNKINANREKYFIEVAFQEEMKLRKSQILNNILKMTLIDEKLKAATIELCSHAILIDQKEEIYNQIRDLFCNSYSKIYLKYQNKKKSNLNYLKNTELQNALQTLYKTISLLKKMYQYIKIDQSLIQKYKDEIKAITDGLYMDIIFQTRYPSLTTESIANFQQIFSQGKPSFAIENAAESTEKLMQPEFQASVTSFEPTLFTPTPITALTPVSALELDQGDLTQFINNSTDHALLASQNAAFNHEYVESVTASEETEQRYNNIEPSEPHASRIEMELEFQAPISLNENENGNEKEQAEVGLAELSAQSDELHSNLNACEADEYELQNIFSEADLQTQISAELEIDFNDPELLNSLDRILSDHLFQV